MLERDQRSKSVSSNRKKGGSDFSGQCIFRLPKYALVEIHVDRCARSELFAHLAPLLSWHSWNIPQRVAILREYVSPLSETIILRIYQFHMTQSGTFYLINPHVKLAGGKK